MLKLVCKCAHAYAGARVQTCTCYAVGMGMNVILTVTHLKRRAGFKSRLQEPTILPSVLSCVTGVAEI